MEIPYNPPVLNETIIAIAITIKGATVDSIPIAKPSIIAVAAPVPAASDTLFTALLPVSVYTPVK